MKAIITRECEYRQHQYRLGEEVRDDEDGAKLVRLGFAQWDEPDKAPAPPPPPQTGVTEYDPSAHTADEVKLYAEGHQTEVSAIIALETDGKNRATVIAALNGILNKLNPEE